MQTSSTPSLPSLDMRRLNRELEQAKSRIFLGQRAAFLAHLMSSMNFVWDEKIKTAATDGVTFWWNPYHFHFIPKENRPTIIAHELWHKALMHMLRRGNRIPKVWNWACDFAINNMMDLEVDDKGRKVYSFDGLFPAELGFDADTKPCLDHQYGTKGAEEIYELLLDKIDIIEVAFPGQGDDLIEPDEKQIDPHTIINQVVAATHAHKLGGQGAGTLPGEVESVLNRFLAPVLPWKQLLLRFFTALTKQDYSWKRPNRRVQHIYLPSLHKKKGGLAHVMAFEDVSGSVSDQEVLRVNSELAFIKNKLKPEKLTLVQFDTKIQRVDEWKTRDDFMEVTIIGRGGTSLRCVRDYIIKHRPTAVLIFSDLDCTPMEKLPFNTPIIWICVNNPDAQVNEGQLIHLQE